jgi:predicted ArsR family transcriptional regulator
VLSFDISDSTKTHQRNSILAALTERGPLTTTELRDDLGVLMPASRIFELRRDGWLIRTFITWADDSEGRPHKQAQYRLDGRMPCKES